MRNVKQGRNPKLPASRAGPAGRISIHALGAIRRTIAYCVKKGYISELPWAIQNTLNWLKRMANGSNTDLRAPFFSFNRKGVRKWIGREQLGKLWEAELMKKGVGPSALDFVYREEVSAISSWSPQSVYPPYGTDMEMKVRQVYSDKPLSLRNNKAWRSAVDELVSMIATNSCEVSTIEEVLDRESDNPHEVLGETMDKTKNSGPPHNQTRWKPDDSQGAKARNQSSIAYEYIKSRSHELLESYLKGIPMPLRAMVSHRVSQNANPEKWERVVIAIEKAQAVIGKMYTPQVYAALRQITCASGCPPFFALMDMPSHDLAAQIVLNCARKGGRTVLSGDYSRYDASLPPELIRTAGRCLATWVKGGQKLVEAQVSSMVDKVSLITPKGVWEGRPSSMKSGDPNTNLLDSLCNLLVLLYGKHAGYYGEMWSYAVQGDDFIVDAEGINPQVMETVAAEFGLTANKTKQEFTEDRISFLQRRHLRGYLGGVFLTSRTIGSIISYERLNRRPKEWARSSGLMDVIRAWAQLENCAFSPYLETVK